MTEDQRKNFDSDESTDLSRTDQVLMLLLAIVPITLSTWWYVAQGMSK
ncbi:hypothetical protein [Rhodococcus sp. NPDC049939]